MANTATSVVDCGFKHRSDQTNVNKCLENKEAAIKSGRSRETGNIGYTRGRKTNKNTIQYALGTTIYKQTQIT